MNCNLHFGELHSDNSINDKNNLFENYIPYCYKGKRILISFNCFSEYTFQKANNKGADQTFADAQAGLRLFCSQTTEGRFFCFESHMISNNEAF